MGITVSRKSHYPIETLIKEFLNWRDLLQDSEKRRQKREKELADDEQKMANEQFIKVCFYIVAGTARKRNSFLAHILSPN